LTGRRVWQFDLDDGARAAALASVLLLAWGVAYAARRAMPTRIAASAALAISLVGAFSGRGSSAWLLPISHTWGPASATGLPRIVSGLQGVGADPDRRRQRLPDPAERPEQRLLLYECGPGAVPGPRARQPGRLFPRAQPGVPRPRVGARR